MRDKENWGEKYEKKDWILHKCKTLWKTHIEKEIGVNFSIRCKSTELYICFSFHS